MEIQTHYHGFVLILRMCGKRQKTTNDIGEKIQCYKLILDVYRTDLSLVYIWQIGREGLKYVEDFKKKYKDRIIQALELEQKQQRH